jgi:hypothetical protein
MSEATVLDCEQIQDTLFGDPQVSAFEVAAMPDADCFCTCNCRTSPVKVSNSDLTSASMWANAMPQP